MVKIIVLCAGTVSLNYEGLVEFPLKDLADGDIATGVRKLYMKGNLLVSLPNAIRQLENLNELQVCQLVKLEELSACGNRLVSLPLDLGHIPTLRSLYVDSNPYLRWLPVSVSALKKLGTNNCGVQVYEEPYPGLSVRTTTEVTVTLPREVVSITSRRNNVRTLMEISLVAAFRNRQQEEIVFEDLPSDLMNLLLCPTASCLHCSLPIFTCAHPLVFTTSDDALLLLGMCCSDSERCAELAKCRVKHRVVYPRD